MPLLLSEILEKVQEVNDFKSSKFASSLAGKTIILDSGNYELRMFFFQHNDSDTITFGDFIRNNNLLDQTSVDLDNGYAVLQYFKEPTNFKEQGMFYLLSLRKL